MSKAAKDVLAERQRKRWVDCNWDDCPECGSGVEAYTICEKPHHLHDGDEIRCAECGYKGNAIVCEETAYVNWLDFEDQPKIVRDRIERLGNGKESMNKPTTEQVTTNSFNHCLHGTTLGGYCYECDKPTTEQSSTVEPSNAALEGTSDMTKKDIADELDCGFNFWTHNEMVDMVRVLDKRLEDAERELKWIDAKARGYGYSGLAFVIQNRGNRPHE